MEERWTNRPRGLGPLCYITQQILCLQCTRNKPRFRCCWKLSDKVCIVSFHTFSPQMNEQTGMGVFKGRYELTNQLKTSLTDIRYWTRAEPTRVASQVPWALTKSSDRVQLFWRDSKCRLAVKKSSKHPTPKIRHIHSIIVRRKSC